MTPVLMSVALPTTPGPTYYKQDERTGQVVADLDSQGNDTEYDSMDLMVSVMIQSTTAWISW